MFMRSGYRAQTRSSGTEHHHRAADVFVGAGDLGLSGGPQARVAGLTAQLASSQPIEADAILAHLPFARDPDDLPAALEHEGRAACAHGSRVARVDDAIDLAHVGHRAGEAIDDLEWLELLRDRDGDAAARLEMHRGPLKERDPSGTTSEQLNRLHRHDTQRIAASIEVEMTRVSADAVDLQRSRSGLERREQLGVDV